MHIARMIRFRNVSFKVISLKSSNRTMDFVIVDRNSNRKVLCAFNRTVSMILSGKLL